MRILVTGATGFIGQAILRALVSKNIDVIAAVRNTEKFNLSLPKVKCIEVDFNRDVQLETWLPRLDNIDLVINTIGIIAENRKQSFKTLHTQAPIALFTACEQVGVKKVIHISALGASLDAISEYHRSKAKADEFLKTLNLDWIILRPSLVYGNGGKSTALFRAMAALPIIPLVDNGRQQVQPVHISDLVDLICKLVCTNNIRRTIVPVVGPEAISFKTMLEYFRQALGLANAVTISISHRLAYLNASFMALFGQKFLSRENLAMLQQGNTADCSIMVKAAGRVPRSMRENLVLEQLDSAERFYARSYFLKPLLRFSLALLWIFSGLVSVFIYPLETSSSMLQQIGIPDTAALPVLYTASSLDIVLGLALLFKLQLRLVYHIQIAVILIYSSILSIWFPHMWGHPFGPISKNLPILVATLLLIAWEEE